MQKLSAMCKLFALATVTLLVCTVLNHMLKSFFGYFPGEFVGKLYVWNKYKSSFTLLPIRKLYLCPNINDFSILHLVFLGFSDLNKVYKLDMKSKLDNVKTFNYHSHKQTILHGFLWSYLNFNWSPQQFKYYVSNINGESIWIIIISSYWYVNLLQIFTLFI